MASPCSPHLSIFIVKCNKTLGVSSRSPLRGLPAAAPNSPVSLGSEIALEKLAAVALVLLVSSHGYTGPPPGFASMLFWEVLVGLLFSILNVLCRPQPFWRMATCSCPSLEAPPVVRVLEMELLLPTPPPPQGADMLHAPPPAPAPPPSLPLLLFCLQCPRPPGSCCPLWAGPWACGNSRPGP